MDAAVPFTLGPLDAEYSFAVVTGQHGDEYAGMAAGREIERMVRRWRAGHPHRVRGPGGIVAFEPPDVAQVRFLVTEGLNGPGLVAGTRPYGATVLPSGSGTLGGVDLNRCWPDGHEVVRPVWDAIRSLPGRVHVVDVHGNASLDVTGDSAPDTFVYSSSACAGLVARCMPEIGVVPVPAGVTGSLAQAAEAVGYWATTLEVGAEAFPAYVGCHFFARLVRVVTSP